MSRLLGLGILLLGLGCSARASVSASPAHSAHPATTVAAPSLPASPKQVRETPASADSCQDCAERTLTVLAPRHSQKAVEQLFLALKQPALALSTETARSKASKVILTAFSNSALDSAFGMEPESDVLGVELLEGQRAEQNVQLMPGKCMTWLAQGGLGTIEIDMALVSEQGGAATVIALDEQEGPIAVLGRGAGCVRHKENKPLSAVLSVLMRKGSGLLLLRSYFRTL